MGVCDAPNYSQRAGCRKQKGRATGSGSRAAHAPILYTKNGDKEMVRARPDSEKGPSSPFAINGLIRHIPSAPGPK